MSTEITHMPAPEFRDYLEGEVVRSYRRHRTFARLRVAAVVVASMAVGTTAGLASAQMEDAARRDSLLAVAQADMALVALRLDLARARLADVSGKVKVGVLGTASLAEAESELRNMEAQAMRAKLNVDEIRATAQAPRDELNAPLVDGRDFVTERLQLDLFAAQQRLTAAEQAYTDAERRATVGAGTELARLDAELEVARARAALGTLAERRKLRKEFTQSGTPGDQLMRRLQQAQLRHEAFVAQQGLDLARKRLEQIRKQRAVGAAAELDQLRAEVELREREVELMSIARQLRALGALGALGAP